jgi:uncharacterized protein YyaL (SSP411 family)
MGEVVFAIIRSVVGDVGNIGRPEGFPPVEVCGDELHPPVPCGDARPRDYVASRQYQAITDENAGTAGPIAGEDLAGQEPWVACIRKNLALSHARRAADWVAAHRSLPGGGFRHSDADVTGPYLGDTLAMGQAYLALYNVTGNRKDLKAAAAAARFIAAHFAPISAGSGFVTSQTPTAAAYRPHPNRDENIALVRFTSTLAVATGDAHFHAAAVEAMRYLAAEPAALAPLSAGVLLANQDVTEAPIHVAIVGAVKRPDAVALHTASLRSIASHELIEIRDPADPSPLPTSVTYPKFDRAALLLCTASACSSPVFKPEDVRGRIQRAEHQSAR